MISLKTDNVLKIALIYLQGHLFCRIFASLKGETHQNNCVFSNSIFENIDIKQQYRKQRYDRKRIFNQEKSIIH